jgi:hypothetical protein
VSNTGAHASNGVMPGAGPLPQSYQVLPFALYAGEYPGAPTEAGAREKLGRLLDAGIRVVVDLTEAGERTTHGPLVPYAALLGELAAERGVTAEWHRLPIRDQDVPRTAEEMDAVVGVLEAAVACGQPAYVHCWGGVGRTGTVVACLLAARGLDGDAALATLGRLFARMPKSAWRVSPENETQCAFVRRWAERLAACRRSASEVERTSIDARTDT